MSGRRGAAAGLVGYVPAVGGLRDYQRSWFRGDLAAGVTTAAVVIPQAMAYATIAGLPVQAGLYVATVPMLVYALLGTSRPLSVSTTSTISALTAAAVAVAAAGDPARALVAASTLAVLAGALLLLAGLLRLGFMADFISVPVLAGFKAGTGLLIAAGQLGKVLGVPQEGDSFFRKVGSALSHLGEISWPTLTLAAGSIAILLALRRWAPRSLPGPLIVVALGILLAVVTGLADRGVALVGTIPPGLPQFAAPDLAMVQGLLPAAAGVALMAFVESIAAGRAFTAGGEPEVDADQELRALGGANLAGGCFQAFPAGGGLSQTAVNRETGARSQLSGVVTAAVVVLTLLFLTPLFENLPQATLGAVVIVAVIGLVDLAALRRILQIRVRDFGLAVVALAGVLVLGVLQGVLLAVVVSMLTLVYGANHPPIEVLGRRPGTGSWRDLGRYPDDETVPGLMVVRPVASIYFANAPGSGGGCSTWPARRRRSPTSCSWTLAPSPTSTSAPSTCCRRSTPSCASAGSPCGWPTSTPDRWTCSAASPMRPPGSSACSVRWTTPPPRSRQARRAAQASRATRKPMLPVELSGVLELRAPTRYRVQ